MFLLHTHFTHSLTLLAHTRPALPGQRDSPATALGQGGVNSHPPVGRGYILGKNKSFLG